MDIQVAIRGMVNLVTNLYQTVGTAGTLSAATIQRYIGREARRIGAATIVMEDLTHIRDRIRAGRRMRARLHRWAFQQLQSFVEYKARAAGISVEYVNPA